MSDQQREFLFISAGKTPTSVSGAFSYKPVSTGYREGNEWIKVRGVRKVMGIKLVASDLDGTLFTDEKTISMRHAGH